MISKIRNSILVKLFSVSMIWIMSFTLIVPFNSFGLTGGPAQPEFNSFTPIGTSDMVDLASGDFNYNIPIMDIGGFPINLAYSSGVTMDQEASWVGLGWDLSIGQINRQMRGIPDDFDGDEMEYQNNIKDNFTIGGNVKFTPAVVGIDIEKKGKIKIIGDGSAGYNPEDLSSLTFGLGVSYNSYTGFALKPSLGASTDQSKMFSVGLDVESGPDGMSLQPKASLSGTNKDNQRLLGMGLKIGAAFNSRQGLMNVNMSASHNGMYASNFKGGREKGSMSAGSSVSYLPNHYTPQVQSDFENESLTINAALGGEFFGAEGQGQVRGYFANQYIPDHKKTSNSKAYGYDNNHKANKHSVRDFNREKDASINVNSTNLPITNYTYDIYSVSGQGVSGMFRPYRSQIGYVTDKEVKSSVNGTSVGVEFGVGNAVHNGGDVEGTHGSSVGGIWDEEEVANPVIPHFNSDLSSDGTYEEVYYKNVGDLSSDNGQIGGVFSNQAPIRINIAGEKYERILVPSFVSKGGSSGSATGPIKRSSRQKRNQTILKVKNSEILTSDGYLLGFNSNPNAKAHHTAGFIVTRNDGARYIYGEALYNMKKQEVAFSMGGKSGGNAMSGLIPYTSGVDDDYEKNKNGDHFFSKVTTPAYAHTYLLTALVSTDYSDIDGNGLSDSDLGSWTKFSYKSVQDYKWRVPFLQDYARYSEGIKSDPEDDRGSYMYGEKEMKYIDTIETKTHIAIFHTSERDDAFGVLDSAGASSKTRTTSEMFKLDSIQLFSKGEYFINGSVNTNAVPIKVAHFEYSYDLCKGANLVNSLAGKLTLEKVFFTYRNSKMGKYSPYVFSYGDINHDGIVSTAEEDLRNPEYSMTDYDIWGGYKKPLANMSYQTTGSPPVPEFNYVEQTDDPDLDHHAAAWTITDIKLPSGGKIKVDFETDDYAFVQNEQAMQMFKVVGAGISNNVSDLNNLDRLFKLANPPSSGYNEASYLYVKLPDDYPLTQNDNFYNDYIKNIVKDDKSLVQFRFFVNMGNKGGKANANSNVLNNANFDYINGYFELKKITDPTQISTHYNVFSIGTEKFGSIPIELVDIGSTLDSDSQAQVNPIAKAGWQFGRKYLSNYIYDLGGVDENADKAVILNTLFQAVQNLSELFTSANRLLRGKLIARRFIPEKSWIRLMNPNGFKKGGGVRVSKIVMSDEWGAMTDAENSVHGDHINTSTDLDPEDRTMEYGQEYFYTTLDEREKVISSGVATYEPVGAKDNPLIQPEFVHIDRVLGPDEENFMETPFGESFFPSPKVTYSKVEVKNLERKRDIDNDANDDFIVRSHATGKVVTEFYTSKDYPTRCDQTDLFVVEDGGKKSDQLIQNLLKVRTRKHIAVSQGYTVHTNDMNGKMKKQLIYAENQDQPISGALYIYKGQQVNVPNPNSVNPVDITSTNLGRLHNNVKVIRPDASLGTAKIGVEVDVINDFREMQSNTHTGGVRHNTAGFTVGPIPFIIPLPQPNYNKSETKVKMAVTTKVINSFGILEKTIAFDAGAAVTTTNTCWDSETGEVILTETSNEFGDNYYSFNYPAHWYYKGMGLASFNSGAEFLVSETIMPGTYNITSSGNAITLGDEVLFTELPHLVKHQLWITQIIGSNFELKDRQGNLFSVPEGKIRIIRSGRRNLQSTSMGSMVSQGNPLKIMDYLSTTPTPQLNNNFYNFSELDSIHSYKVINAGAVEFDSFWSGCLDELPTEGGGTSIVSTNMYVLNLKGIYRASTSYLYLAKRYQNRNDLGTVDDSNTGTGNLVDTRNDGFYSSFNPFYMFGDDGTGANNWHIDKDKWTYTTTVTNYSPYGFELENADALGRYSSAQYGYNNMFPMAVSANAMHSEIGFDGFEDYNFSGVGSSANTHFSFYNSILGTPATIDMLKSHTGRKSVKVPLGQKVEKEIKVQ